MGDQIIYFQFEIIINVLALSASFEYIYVSTTIIHVFLILSARDRLYTSESRRIKTVRGRKGLSDFVKRP